MSRITESAVEEDALEWFDGLGFAVAHGPEIAVDGSKPERSSYADVVLVERLRTALTNINPVIPPDAIEEAISKSLRLRCSWRPGTSQRLTCPADPLHAACAKGHDRSTWSCESTELNGRNQGIRAQSHRSATGVHPPVPPFPRSRFPPFRTPNPASSHQTATNSRLSPLGVRRGAYLPGTECGPPPPTDG